MCLAMFCAGPEGIEPPLEDLESPGLPLTYGPKWIQGYFTLNEKINKEVKLFSYQVSLARNRLLE